MMIAGFRGHYEPRRYSLQHPPEGAVIEKRIEGGLRSRYWRQCSYCCVEFRVPSIEDLVDIPILNCSESCAVLATRRR